MESVLGYTTSDSRERRELYERKVSTSSRYLRRMPLTQLLLIGYKRRVLPSSQPPNKNTSPTQCTPEYLQSCLLSYRMVVLECIHISVLPFLRRAITHFIASLRCKGEGQTWKFPHGSPSQRFYLAVWIEGRVNYRVWCTDTQIQALWAAEHG